VGVVSIQRTNMDLLVAGNVVRAMQAQMGGDAGAEHGLALAGTSPEETARRLEAQRLMALGHAGIQAPAGVNASMSLSQLLFSYSSAVPDPSGADVNQHMPVVDGDNPLARSRQDIAYDLQVTYVTKTEGKEGYQTGGDICHLMFDFNARGGVPSQLEPVNVSLPPLGTCNDTVTVRTRARALVGPVSCK